MDNLCHSLVGAALASAGLNRRTAFAATTLVIGANLPDVDALLYLFGEGASALAFRRGWTHGVLAMVVLPILLAGAVAGIGGPISRRRSRRSGATGAPGLRPGQLLMLAAIAVWSHPLLDLLNTYGVRLLMPFSGRWFYGDTLFIIDPWMWITLGIGASLSALLKRRLALSLSAAAATRRSERPARIALVLAGAYVAVMGVSSAAGRNVVERQAVEDGGAPALRTMVSPAPATPFRRSVVRDLGDSYEVGHLTWGRSPSYTRSGEPIPTRLDSPAARAAAQTRAGAQFLGWSRFPFAETDSQPNGVVVHLRDARYAAPGTNSWAAVTIVVPATSAP